MKVLYLFVVSLCFLLFGGWSNAHAGTHYKHTRYSSVHCNENSPQVKLANSNQDITVLKGSAESKEPEFLISSEDEDESLSARRYLLQDKYSLIVSYTLVLSLLYSSFKDRLPLCKHLSYTSSYKYIILRALRI